MGANLGSIVNSVNGAAQSGAPAQGGTDPITNLYQTLLGRAPDAAGLQFWQNALNNGVSLDSITQSFKTSPEYQQKQASGGATPVTPATKNPSTQANTNPYGITTSNPYASSTNPYVQAAQQTSLGNLAGAQTATSANRVNQSTPYSSLNYTQTGTDAQGNPIWSANQSLNPALQGTMNNLTGNLTASSANPFSVAGTQNQMVGQGPSFQQVGTAQQAQGVGSAPNLQTQVGGTGMQGWDAATGMLMQRLQPQIDRSNAALDAQLANQGIMPGSAAYSTAKQQQAQSNNDLLTQAQLAGSQVQNTMFNQNLGAGQFTNQALTGQNTMNLANTQLGNQAGQQNYTNQLAGTQFNNATGQQNYTNQLAGTSANNQANQNNYAQNLAAYNLPLTQLGAFNQATQPGYVNAYNQQAVSGPDYTNAYSTAQNAQIAQQNQQIAQQANLQNGLFGLGSSAILGGGGVGNLASTIGNGATSAYNGLSSLFNGTPGLGQTTNWLGQVVTDPTYGQGGSAINYASQLGDVGNVLGI